MYFVFIEFMNLLLVKMGRCTPPSKEALLRKSDDRGETALLLTIQGDLLAAGHKGTLATMNPLTAP